MRTWSTPTLVLLAALALAAAGALLGGCESKPAAPVFENPWDPDSPTGGDALRLNASAGDTTITLFWTHPRGHGITLYVISHTLDPDAGWEEVGEVAAPNGDQAVYTYANPAPTDFHYFRVQAFSDDEFSIVAYTRIATALTPPRLVPAEGGKGRASRYLDLELTVNAGDSVRLADNDTFAGAIVVTVDLPGEPQLVPWDLGTAPAGSTMSVFAQAFGGGGPASPVAKAAFTASFGPRQHVAGRPATLAARAIDLVIPTEGVVAMRLALGAAALEAAPWQAPADTIHDFLLAESANPQEIHAEYEGDFGYTTGHVLTVRPDDLAGAAFALDVPANRVIDVPTVLAENDAVATLMRFSESPGFAGAAWRAYADTADIALSPGEGRKVVYAQFRNDWADSPILTAYVDVVRQPVAVAFLAPSAGADVIGGRALQVRGTAVAGSLADGIDSVRVDLGDGQGWRAPTGRASWALMWDVPPVTEGTDVTLRARAWSTDTLTAVVDSATAAVTVTVQPDTLGSVAGY